MGDREQDALDKFERAVELNVRLNLARTVIVLAGCAVAVAVLLRLAINVAACN